MIAKGVKIKEVVLTLSEDEAEWLKANMQNPLHSAMLDGEDVQDATYRQRFFNALRDALKP